MTFLFCITIYVMCVVKPEWGPPGDRTSMVAKIKAIPGASEMIVLFTLIMGGLYSGAYTPTEAGAAGAFFAVVLGVIRRKLSWKGFIASVVDTLKISCMIIVIIAGAVIFGRFLTISGLPFQITEFAASLAVPPWVVMAVILLVYGDSRLSYGRFGVSAGVDPHLLSFGNEPGLRPDLVRLYNHRGDDHGSHYSSCRYQCLRGRRNEQRYPHGNHIQRRVVVHSGLHPDHGINDALSPSRIVPAVASKIATVDGGFDVGQRDSQGKKNSGSGR